MAEIRRPTVEVLDGPTIDRVVDEALDVLERRGVLVENPEALAILRDHGAPVDRESGNHRDPVRIPRALVTRALATPPARIHIYDRAGQPALDLGDLRVHFNPGSAAIRVLDHETGEIRPGTAGDLVRIARVTDALAGLAAQSTAVVAFDVPPEVQDAYRLYLALQHGAKPVITGTFAAASFELMREMLVVVRGDAAALHDRPLAIFDCCPTAPLCWSALTIQSLMDCARAGIPAEIVSAPMAGATAPVTLLGALVQHTAENLSGLAIHQLAAPGAPVIYGGSPGIFDLRHGNTPHGAIETVLIAIAAAQVGRRLGLPTHGYLGLTDSKVPDAQGGLEAGLGAICAALAGVNVVSGPGMMDFQAGQSLEKLVIDNEICLMALRFVRGIDEKTGERLAEELLGDLSAGDHFLLAESTLRYHQQEARYPGPTIYRRSLYQWLAVGRPDAWSRAREQVRAILAEHRPPPLDGAQVRALQELMTHAIRRWGMAELPALPEE